MVKRGQYRTRSLIFVPEKVIFSTKTFRIFFNRTLKTILMFVEKNIFTHSKPEIPKKSYT